MLFLNCKEIFNKFDLCLTANLETKKYLLELGAQNIIFNGNLKFINITKKKILVKIKIFFQNRFWIGKYIQARKIMFRNT